MDRTKETKRWDKTNETYRMERDSPYLSYTGESAYSKCHSLIYLMPNSSIAKHQLCFTGTNFWIYFYQRNKWVRTSWAIAQVLRNWDLYIFNLTKLVILILNLYIVNADLLLYLYCTDNLDLTYHCLAMNNKSY